MAPDGNRRQVFAFGPAVKYDDKGMNFVGSWHYETSAENHFESNKFLFKFTIMF